MKYFLAIVSIVLLLISCNESDVYNSYVALPNTGWGDDSLAVFRVNIDNVDSPYDINFQIRNESNYKYANLWLFVDVVSPDGEMQRDTIECMLADDFGKWYGHGISLYEMSFPIKTGYRFLMPVTFQCMRTGYG